MTWPMTMPDTTHSVEEVRALLNRAKGRKNLITAAEYLLTRVGGVVKGKDLDLDVLMEAHDLTSKNSKNAWKRCRKRHDSHAVSFR